ncbi:MAG: hypothetical protein HY721_31705 [Planctomycetes bacterium]|nr:hypothetical protein [Planctomycetota bacterium]
MTRRERLAFQALLTLLALSGAAALGVEVVLSRVLQRTLGSTSLAVASVTAGFLGGMGLGAFAGERALPRVARPLLAYGACELLALLGTGLLGASEGAVAWCAGLPGGDGLVLLLVALLAAPYGAGFPFVLEALPRDGGLAARVRAAYGVNALGGATGAGAAGLAGVPGLGEPGTLAACAAAQAIVGAAAVLLGRAEEPRPAAAVSPPGALAGVCAPAGVSAPASLRAPAGLAAAAGYVFLSGLVVLYWEVLWTRILVLTVGATVYAFSVIAAGVLLGIGAGSLAAGGRALERHGPWALPLLAALLLAAGHHAVPWLPDAYLLGARSLGASPLLWGALGAGAVAFLPSFVLGSLFPCVVAPRTARAGTLYAASSAGAVLGVFCGGPIAASCLGLEAAYQAGTLAAGGLATFGLFLDGGGSRAGAHGAHGAHAAHAGHAAHGAAGPSLRWLRAAAALAIAGGLAAAAALAPSWDPKRLLSGVYQWPREDLLELPLEESLRSRELLRVEPGRESIVSVELDREANTVYVRGNGKVEGSVPADPSRPSLADLPTQILLGSLAADLLHGERGRRALLVGLGSGVTLGALLEGGGGVFAPSDVDVVEIERAFLEAIRDEAARPYLEPFVRREVLEPGSAAAPRFRFGDARRLLRSELRGRTWHAIVSQPSEPWIPGAAPLFTAEFFEEAAARLEEGGVFLQWLQVYKLDLEVVRLLARTFRRAFPQVVAFRPPGTGELILAGSFRPLPLERLLDAPAGRLLAAAGLEVPADRLAIALSGPAALDAWVGLAPGLPVNEDRRSQVEFLGARSLHADPAGARANLEALRALGGRDPIARHLPERLRGDRAFLRLLASRDVRLGDLPEARETLRGDDSPEARLILEGGDGGR